MTEKRQLNGNEEEFPLDQIPMEKLRDIVGLVLEHLQLKIIRTEHFRNYPEYRYSYELTDEELIPYDN